MTSLRSALTRYVGIRQGLGYKYNGPAQRLSDFVTFMEQQGADVIQPSWRCPGRHCRPIDIPHGRYGSRTCAVSHVMSSILTRGRKSRQSIFFRRFDVPSPTYTATRRSPPFYQQPCSYRQAMGFAGGPIIVSSA